jgi:hypothetical protein
MLFNIGNPFTEVFFQETEGVPSTPSLRQCSVLRVFKAKGMPTNGKVKNPNPA